MALFAKILKKIFHHPCLKYQRIAQGPTAMSNLPVPICRTKTKLQIICLLCQMKCKKITVIGESKLGEIVLVFLFPTLG